MSDTVTLTLAEAETLARTALMQAGASEAAAISTAKSLVRAQADGQSGHGLMRVISYSGQVRTGKVTGDAVPKLAEIKPAVVGVDAGHGFAYPAIDMAIEALVPVTRAHGIGMAAITRSHHFGQAGAHAERLAERGLVAMIYGNSPKAIAFWGSATPMMGTNPIAFAAPTPDGAPLMIDLAVSRVARGKIVAAEKLGDPIPEGWALDADGQPTTDATAGLEGSMIPIGEAKGAAIAMVVEILSAALTASFYGWESHDLFREHGPAPNLGQVIIAIDPGPPSQGRFLSRMADLMAAITAADGARVPGVRRLDNRARAAAEGLTIPKRLYDQIAVLTEG